jgi:pimeloyl-ACP methyl ester carboxylesterase
VQSICQSEQYIIPNSDLFWLDECGHAAMMEKPEEFNEILYNWLKDKI